MSIKSDVSDCALAVAFAHALAIAAGCTPAPSTYDVAYYRSHSEERKAKIAECRNDPGALQEDALCVNAYEAESQERVGGLRRLPPLGLVEAEKAAEQKRLDRGDGQ